MTVDARLVGSRVGNPLLDYYEEQAAHQRGHGGTLGFPDDQPWTHCRQCLREGVQPDGGRDSPHDVRLRWSWAIPTDRAIRTIVQHSPNGAVELGAGTGYWARLLSEAGCDVAAYDVNPPGGGGPRVDGDKAWHVAQEVFYPVEYGTSTVVQRHADRTLFLCWPCYSDPMAYHAARQYEGDTIVYIGESAGGCTADDRFHKLVGGSPCWHTDDDFNEVDVDAGCEVCEVTPEWGEVADVALPQWAGMHDRLYVYRRLP